MNFVRLPLLCLSLFILSGCGGPTLINPGKDKIEEIREEAPKIYQAMKKDQQQATQIAEEVTTSTEFFLRMHQAGLFDGLDPAILAGGVVKPAASWEEFDADHNGWCIVRPLRLIGASYHSAAYPVLLSRNITALNTEEMLDKEPAEIVTKGSHLLILDCEGMIKSVPTKGRAATPPFRSKSSVGSLATPANLEILHP